MVDQQSLETGCARSRKISLHLVADVQNLMKVHLESFNRGPEDASRRFSSADLTGDDLMLEGVSDAQMRKNIIETRIEIRDYPKANFQAMELG